MCTQLADELQEQKAEAQRGARRLDAAMRQRRVGKELLRKSLSELQVDLTLQGQ